MTDIILLYFFLLTINCLTEFLLYKMIMAIGVLKKKYFIYHIVCAILRIMWLCLSAWFLVPLPLFLIGLLFFLYLNSIPYRTRSLLINHFTIIIYLIYTFILMTVIGISGLAGMDVSSMIMDKAMRSIVLNITLIVFNIICFLLLRYRPSLLWLEEVDRFKVVIYTRFLIICVIYHLFDAIILTFYSISRVNYFLLVSGDFLILVLMYNFLAYNYVFEKSKRMKKEWEENEILVAQQHFEKEALRKLSKHDALTNTYNRREISEIMQKHIVDGHKLSCVFIDLDGLKRINDTYGHAFGDLMLKRFADACSAILSDNDSLARIGGDEFLLVFPDREIVSAESLIRNLQQKLLEPTEEKDKIYFSYGISYNEESAEQYIKLADQKMYECKKRKRCDDK